MKIIWTDFAKVQLRNVFDYYAEVASKTVAKNIISGIRNRTILLRTHPNIGTIEELLMESPHKYRYLVENNYKIIYRIEDSIIYITDIFDTHQNPNKLKIRNL